VGTKLRVFCCAAWVAAGCLVGLLAGCASPGHGGVDAAAPAPRFDGLGPHTRAVSTGSPEAQRYFNQGLVWA
jgi:hypothetical protein